MIHVYGGFGRGSIMLVDDAAGTHGTVGGGCLKD